MGCSCRRCCQASGATASAQACTRRESAVPLHFPGVCRPAHRSATGHRFAESRARRHGRVLRVGRAARRPVAARHARWSSPGAARARWSARRPTRRASSACARRCRRCAPSGCARRRCSCRRTSCATRRCRGRCARSSRATPTWSSRCRSTRPTSTSPQTRPACPPPPRRREAIRAEIREETQLTASAGVAPNKFLAKIASDWRKPDGLFVIRPHQVEAFLAPLPVGRMPGVGKVMEAQARRAGHRHGRRPARARRGRNSSSASAAGAGACTSWRSASTSIRCSPNGRRMQISAEDTFERDLPLDELEPHIRRARREGLGRLRARTRANARTHRRAPWCSSSRPRDFRILTRSLTPPMPPASLRASSPTSPVRCASASNCRPHALSAGRRRTVGIRRCRQRRRAGRPVRGGARPGLTLRGHHQITTCLSPSRTIGSPGLHENAAANAGRFDGAPIARKLAGACSSVVEAHLQFVRGEVAAPHRAPS